MGARPGLQGRNPASSPSSLGLQGPDAARTEQGPATRDRAAGGRKRWKHGRGVLNCPALALPCRQAITSSHAMT